MGSFGLAFDLIQTQKRPRKIGYFFFFLEINNI